MYVCVVYSLRMPPRHNYIHTHLQIQTHTYTYVHIHARTHNYTHTYLTLHARPYMHKHTYIHPYIHTHSHILYIYTWIHACIHAYHECGCQYDSFITAQCYTIRVEKKLQMTVMIHDDYACETLSAPGNANRQDEIITTGNASKHGSTYKSNRE